MRDDCKPGPREDLANGHWCYRDKQFDTCARCGQWRRDHPYNFCTGNMLPGGCQVFMERDDKRKHHASSIGSIYIEEK